MNADERLLRVIFDTPLGEEERERLAAARVRSQRARTALGEAPTLAQHIRSQVLLTDGRTESGTWTPQATTPLLTVKADDGDQMYARLLEWVAFWGEQLGGMVPSTVEVAWRRVDMDSRAAQPDPQYLGFKAGTTAAGARFLTSMLTSWLLVRHERIIEHESGEAYLDDVTKLVWDLRARYKLTPARERLVSPRACPACGERAVHASWGSADITDVEISCEVCGFTEPRPSASKIERWLSASNGPSASLSSACVEWRHQDCLTCDCGCHPTLDGLRRPSTDKKED